MAQQIPWRSKRFAFLEIGRTRDQLMPISQDPPRDQRRILKRANPENQVDAINNVVNGPFRKKNLHADVRIGRLEWTDQRHQQRVGDAWWR